MVSIDGGFDISSTTTSLPLHSDFSYVMHPPGIMMLHCLRYDEHGCFLCLICSQKMTSKWKNGIIYLYCRLDSSVVGGESVLLDGYSVAEELREKHPLEFANSRGWFSWTTYRT